MSDVKREATDDLVPGPSVQSPGAPVPDVEIADAPAAGRAGATEAATRTPSVYRRAVRRYRKNIPAMIALVFIVFMVFLALLGPTLAPHNPAEQSLNKFASPSGEHLLGTDDLGRDTLSRMMVGTRVSVRAGFQVTAMALALAVPLGLLTGYIGGLFDLILLRVMDAIVSFPALVLTLAVASILGPGLNNAMLAITIVIVPSFVRLIRAQTLTLREETYIEASRAIGTGTATILRKRVIPGVLSPLIVAATLLLGTAMLVEAGLSFLGLGQQPPAPSWGNMLERGFQFIFNHPTQSMIPGIAIALAILSFNVMGDGLRDSLGLVETSLPKGVKRGRLGLTSAKAGIAAERQPAGTLLAVRDLEVEFATAAGPVTVVTGVSFDVKPGEVVGLVGESGCGKSVTSAAIMRLISSPPGRITSGEVWFDGRDMLTLPFGEMRKLRGDDIAMVFQDPMSSLDPAFTIGHQLMETVLLHRKVPKSEARRIAADLLTKVGISDVEARLDEYPHRLSGGMRQRVLIAMALVNEPKLVIADEPTTALDVTVQAQILDLLKGLQKEMGMAMVFVTHDLGVVADICDRVQVMYAGQIIEHGTVEEVFRRPRHPYTKALLGAIPQLAGAGERLVSIPGTVPLPSMWPHGCRFSTRCDFVTEACTAAPVALESVGSQAVRCIRHAELDGVTSATREGTR